MQRTLIGVSGKMQNISLRSADFHSGDVTCSFKAIQCMLETRFSVSKQDQVVSKKQATDFAASNRDTLIGSAVLIDPIHVYYEEEW